MARIIHEMRLLCLAIILPALIVAAGGLRLIWIGWQTGKVEERDTLQSQAVLYWDTLQSRAVEAGLDDHRPPEHRNDPHPRHRPPHRPPNAPRHMWRDLVLEKLPEIWPFRQFIFPFYGQNVHYFREIHRKVHKVMNKLWILCGELFSLTQP